MQTARQKIKIKKLEVDPSLLPLEIVKGFDMNRKVELIIEQSIKK